MYRPNLKSVALPVRETITLKFFVGVANPNLGEEEAIGVAEGMPFVGFPFFHSMLFDRVR